LTGCIKQQYDDVMDGVDIAAVCFDATKRKMIVGDVHGRIHIFNAMSGTSPSDVVFSIKIFPQAES
jgi:hypothetical protein